MDQPKFNLVEIILGSLFAFTIDILAAITDLLSFGILGFLVQGFSWLMFTLWFTLKGVKATASLAKRFIIPIVVQFVPILPTMTITFLITVYMENHPEKFGVFKTVASTASGKPKIT